MKILPLFYSVYQAFSSFFNYLLLCYWKNRNPALYHNSIGEEFEIRYYPPVTIIMITSSAKTFRELGRSGFGKIGRLHFCGNKANKQIAMTALVHMDIGDSVSSMSFVNAGRLQWRQFALSDNSDINIKPVPGNVCANYVWRICIVRKY